MFLYISNFILQFTALPSQLGASLVLARQQKVLAENIGKVHITLFLITCGKPACLANTLSCLADVKLFLADVLSCHKWVGSVQARCWLGL